jgi:hypothetical protein
MSHMTSIHLIFLTPTLDELYIGKSVICLFMNLRLTGGIPQKEAQRKEESLRQTIDRPAQERRVSAMSGSPATRMGQKER